MLLITISIENVSSKRFIIKKKVYGLKKMLKVSFLKLFINIKLKFKQLIENVRLYKAWFLKDV